MSETIVCASLYANPIHVGHIEYLERSKSLGDKLIVIVNTDKQSFLKRGTSFMPENERLKIVRSLRCVDMAILAVDDDVTVCKTLCQLHPDIFTRGSNKNNTIPERDICERLGIKFVDNLGYKIQSSSWLIAMAKTNKN